MKCQLPKDTFLKVREYIATTTGHDMEEYKSQSFGEYSTHLRCKNCKAKLAAAPVRTLTKAEYEVSKLSK